jgi:LPXTG-motif cell wall-anchored protein
MTPFAYGTPLEPGQPLFFVIGGLILVGLVGLLFVLRNRREDED